MRLVAAVYGTAAKSIGLRAISNPVPFLQAQQTGADFFDKVFTFSLSSLFLQTTANFKRKKVDP